MHFMYRFYCFTHDPNFQSNFKNSYKNMNYYTFKTMVMQTKYELNIIHFIIYCVNKQFFQNLYCHTAVPSIDDNKK